MSYGYYPQYYTSGQTNYSQSPYQLSQHYQYYTPQQSSFSTSSRSQPDTDLNLNQAPVAANWLNQGTNAFNPYTQQQAYIPADYQSQPVFTYSKQPYGQQTDAASEKTFTSRSNRSKAESNRAPSRTSQIISEALREDVNQLTPQIEAAYEAATGKRRSPVVKRQVITVPGQAGRVQQVVRRLPTPTPDVIERIFIVKPQRDTINLIIERPSTPPVQYKDKMIYGKSRRPIINPKIVSVQPSHYYPQLENAPYYNQFQPIQDASAGYLLAPVKYTEPGSQMQAIGHSEQTGSIMQTYNQTNPSRQPTFSTNILQPYNPPMLEQYAQQVANYQGFSGYQPGFGQQQLF